MPNRTIYIRNEDLEKWDALEDRPGFIHNALNQIGLPENYGKTFQTQGDTKAPFPPVANVPIKTPKISPLNADFGPIPKSFSARRKK